MLNCDKELVGEIVERFVPGGNQSQYRDAGADRVEDAVHDALKYAAPFLVDYSPAERDEMNIAIEADVRLCFTED